MPFPVFCNNDQIFVMGKDNKVVLFVRDDSKDDLGIVTHGLPIEIPPGSCLLNEPSPFYYCDPSKAITGEKLLELGKGQYSQFREGTLPKEMSEGDGESSGDKTLYFPKKI